MKRPQKIRRIKKDYVVISFESNGAEYTTGRKATYYVGKEGATVDGYIDAKRFTDRTSATEYAKSIGLLEFTIK